VDILSKALVILASIVAFASFAGIAPKLSRLRENNSRLRSANAGPMPLIAGVCVAAAIYAGRPDGFGLLLSAVVGFVLWNAIADQYAFTISMEPRDHV
jgi:hypothetical protein